MNELLQNLIEALREELKQYGETLALLDDQQRLVIRHQGLELLQSIASIEAQAHALRVVRDVREQRRRHLARMLEREEDLGFRELIPLLPDAFQPLIEALVRENYDLQRRVRLRAQQNYMRLSRALELMHRFINTLEPGAAPGTSTAAGPAPIVRIRSPYDAVG